MGGDVGYYPDWVNNTCSYLGAVNSSTGRGTGSNADVNVIIWSWCGQVSGKYTNGTLASEYLTPMTALESEYFGIKFVYMTGHLDHWDDVANKAANQTIRDYCTTNNKILFDFADIESYNPDNTFYQYAGDDCSYYTANGTLLGNWATEWQEAHTITWIGTIINRHIRNHSMQTKRLMLLGGFGLGWVVGINNKSNKYYRQHIAIKIVSKSIGWYHNHSFRK